MSIYKVNEDLSPKDKVRLLNTMIMELNGNIASSNFTKNEIDDIYSNIGYARKYLRDVGLGNTVSDYTDWTHLKAEDGYSIWKITPDNYSHDSTNQVYLDGKVLENRGLATSESATSFTKVFNYDGTLLTYTDNTTEAATETGTEFSLMDSTSDYMYIGDAAVFNGVKFEFQTRGSSYTLKVEYYNGGWTELTANTNNLEDDTNDFISDGQISFTQPGDWATTSVNGSTLYWIRISTTTTPVTVAKAYYVIPTSSIPGLLALSSEQIQREEWAWAAYNGSIYVTIRNTGVTAYEGNYYITSGSTATNKENFFVHNHQYTADYENNLSISQQLSTLFQAASGVTITIGDLIYISGSYELSLANADTNTKGAVGVCTSVTDDEIRFVSTGVVKNVNTVGDGDIVAGDLVYLSTTAGKVIKNTGSGYSVYQQIGIAVSAESSSKVDVLLNLQTSPVIL